MQPRAVIYCSKHGATKELAQCLGKKYNLPVISIDHISGYSFQNIPVYFCGWIRNGKIMGLTKASKLFMCVQVIGVGAVEYNEAYELKLKYKNKLVNQDFKYIQSSSIQQRFIIKSFRKDVCGCVSTIFDRKE